MIFCGDLVYPGAFSDSHLSRCESEFWHMPKFINLESSIDLGAVKKLTKGIALQSSPHVVDFLHEISAVGVALANNHFFDYQIDCQQQLDYLSGNAIHGVGVGNNIKQASHIYFNEEENMVVMAFGWDVIGCIPATKSRAGVNPHNYDWVLACVKSAKNSYPQAQLVTVFHWNYEFEKYPQPADRSFAFHLVDHGVDAVIGHHAHIIQGFEYYKGKPIFYGLGNLYFPNGQYDGLSLVFPPDVNYGLSVEIKNGAVFVYVTEFYDNNKIRVIEQGKPESISRLIELSSFSGLDHEGYKIFFKKNRLKRKILPIYNNFENKIINKIKDIFVMSRQIPIDLLCRIRESR